MTPSERSHFIRSQMPAEGLFAGLDWRISPEPFALGRELAKEIESLGRVLLRFYRAVNLLYRKSAEGKMPGWVAGWLDQGKPPELIELQRCSAFKNDVPRVIRPDVLLTESGLAIVELDSVPGGIGVTAWLNHTYEELLRIACRGLNPPHAPPCLESPSPYPLPQERGCNGLPEGEATACQIVGGADGMLRGFEGIFGEAPKVHVVVSEEAATYRPEMNWLCRQMGNSNFHVQNADFTHFGLGEAVYRFFELFDLPNVPNAKVILELAREKKIRLTPPPKPMFEEKMLFALLWNRNLRDFWRQELGEGFFDRLRRCVPYTWVMDPGPLPPHGGIPELDLTDWSQLKSLSQRKRDLILKVSGFSESAWGARGVHLGSDLSQEEWSGVVEAALGNFAKSPSVLQRFHTPKTVSTHWYDFSSQQLTPMPGRVRLCPYYFLAGEGDAARANLGGVLATICPSDKKIIHGMSEAILAPCSL